MFPLDHSRGVPQPKKDQNGSVSFAVAHMLFTAALRIGSGPRVELVEDPTLSRTASPDGRQRMLTRAAESAVGNRESALNAKYSGTQGLNYSRHFQITAEGVC